MKRFFNIFLLLCPPSKKRGHIALHVSVGRKVGRSVCNLFVSDQLLKNAMTYLPQTSTQMSTHPYSAAEEPYWVWGHWVKGQGHRGEMCKNYNFENEFLLHTCMQLILNWLIQLYKTSVTKKHRLLLKICFFLRSTSLRLLNHSVSLSTTTIQCKVH